MNDTTRAALAFLVVIGILFLWTSLNRPKKTETPLESNQPLNKDSVEKSSITPQEIDQITMSGDTIVIDKKETRIVLSSTGGSVKSFYLKKYNVDIVPHDKYLFISKIDKDTNIIHFNHIQFEDSIVFMRKVANKEIRKVYYFDEFGFRIATYMPENTRQILSLKSGLNITELKNKGEDLRNFGVYVKDEKLKNITKNIKDEFEYAGDIDWFALKTKYFLLVINNHTKIDKLRFYKIMGDVDVAKKTALNNLRDVTDKEYNQAVFGCPYLGTGGGSNRYGAEIIGFNEINISVLLLPIKYSKLAEFKKGYEAVDAGGIWGPIARIILLIFNFLFSIIKNYGFAIIIFALLIKGIFFPLSKKMIVSQHKMQLLQPELKKVQQRHKDNPQKLNQEMMQLYKAYNVNPFSGCLPLIIQMPIFFALYQTLISSIEFRQAPFMLWITDLSLKDPYYVLPIGMGIMMLIQSLATTIDPRQRFMIVFMPIFLVIIFLNLPSGLQLYWFAFNILTLVEHYITKRGGIK